MRDRRLWALLGVLCFAGRAKALDPNRDISQYLRDQWGAQKGFPGGYVYSITQTREGYLWIATDRGLVRFDGLNFLVVRPFLPASYPAAPILGLATDSDGELWAQMPHLNALRYRNEKLEEIPAPGAKPTDSVNAMWKRKDGGLLLLSSSKGLLLYKGGKFATLAPPAALPDTVISLAEAHDGKIWIGTRDTGLFVFSEGQVSKAGQDLPDRKINCLLPVGDHDLWIGTDNGVARWNGNETSLAGVPRALHDIQALAMASDRESNIWVGGSSGLYRINSRGISSVEQSGEGLSGPVTALFEDREGDLWAGRPRGIERFRDSAFFTYSSSRGLPSENNGPLYPDAEGRTWFAPSEGGLFWLRGTQIEKVDRAGLANDVIYSIAGGAGELWAGRQRGGLTRLYFRGAALETETYGPAQGLAQSAVYVIHRSRDGTIWAGTLTGGVSAFRKGRFSTYTTANGLASNTVSAIEESADGTMWFGTPNGLNALSEGRWRLYSSRDGLPPGKVNCLFEDSTGILWIGTAKGLALVRSGHVQVPHGASESLYEEIAGIAEDRRGWLWIATSDKILRARRDGLLRGELGDGDIREYGVADGLQGTECAKRSQSVAADSMGQIWFSTNRGISVVDPDRLAGSSVPAIVHIQTISADGNPIDRQGDIRIPAGPQRVTFSYAGVTLSVPERVRFRYRLDGFDHEWSAPVAMREAGYTNLGPGWYRFRVMAANADGVWNSGEDVLVFEIEPAFWQTPWFRLACIAAFLLAGWTLFRLRMRQMAMRLNLRFEERLAERTRIAQDLHDTLLQGLLSASMQLHVAVDGLPAESPQKAALSRVLRLMGKVVDEGRNAVRGLRASSSNSLDLEQAFSRIRQELAGKEQIGFRVIVEGRSRPLHPLLRDEVYRIGREALVNAFRHARAKRIEVEIEYTAHHLRILVRDDGCGIDPQVLQSGREGHWGMTGMRERAERIGGRLSLWSRATAGTEVELYVPGHIAFRSKASRQPFGWLKRLYPRKTEAVKAPIEKNQ